MTATPVKPTLDDLQRWFLLSWAPVDADFVSLQRYAEEKFPPPDYSGDESFADHMLEALGKKLHKCPARDPKQLRKWCYRQIDKIAAKLNKPRCNKKALLYEQHGQKVFIKLTDSQGRPHLWVIPIDWLEWAKLLKPYVRRYPDGRPYLARKVPVVQRDGSTVQKEVGIHRLFMGLRAVNRRHSDAAEVRAKDGNWLNFCDDNLEIIKGRDLLDRCLYLGDSVNGATLDWTPAQSRNTKTEEGREGRNWHERTVEKWLGGGLDANNSAPPDDPRLSQREDDLRNEYTEDDREDFYE